MSERRGLVAELEALGDALEDREYNLLREIIEQTRKDMEAVRSLVGAWLTSEPSMPAGDLGAVCAMLGPESAQNTQKADGMGENE